MSTAEHQRRIHEDARRGRIIALDLGTEQTGIAVCDESQIAVRRVATLPRMNWKAFVEKIKDLSREFDARAIVIGLPLNMDGTRGDAAENAARIARNLSLSLTVPIYLQDERLSSQAAVEELRGAGLSTAEIKREIHSQSAAIILRDFIALPVTERSPAAVEATPQLPLRKC